MVLASVFLAILPVLAPPTELNAYVLRPDKDTKWEVREESAGFPKEILLTSQMWQKEKWKHTLYIQQPKQLKHKGTMLLHVTGGKPNDADKADSQIIADKSGMPIVTLYHIPNQPLFGKTEDGLIALTMQRYLESGDATWPLLFPMVKSVRETMNSVQSTFKPTKNPISKFVVFGASKRGWTTWLAAATGDQRIVGIAPMIYDNLGLSRQMKHQFASWDGYSEQIRDYTSTGLLDVLETPEGKKLEKMVDPIAYLSSIKCPVLMINGSNDPYWTVDALSLYWDELKMPKAVSIIPNAGHNLGDKRQAFDVLSSFAVSTTGAFKFPMVDMRLSTANGRHIASYAYTGVNMKRNRVLWTATSDDLKFHGANWKVENSLATGRASGGMESGGMPIADTKRAKAAFVAVEYEAAGHRFILTSPAKVVKKATD